MALKNDGQTTGRPGQTLNRYCFRVVELRAIWGLHPTAPLSAERLTDTFNRSFQAGWRDWRQFRGNGQMQTAVSVWFQNRCNRAHAGKPYLNSRHAPKVIGDRQVSGAASAVMRDSIKVLIWRAWMLQEHKYAQAPELRARLVIWALWRQNRS